MWLFFEGWALQKGLAGKQPSVKNALTRLTPEAFTSTARNLPTENCRRRLTSIRELCQAFHRIYIRHVMTWTKQTPSKPGWYWLLNPNEEPGLPTIVQIFFDWETGRSRAIIPPSRPGVSGRVQDLQGFDALWAGPIELPVVLANVA